MGSVIGTEKSSVMMPSAASRTSNKIQVFHVVSFVKEKSSITSCRHQPVFETAGHVSGLAICHLQVELSH